MIAKFNKLISSFNTVVTRYKARRAKAVVAEYVTLFTTSVEAVLPHIGALYTGVADVVVDQTLAKPEIATRLVEALRDAAAHYGPALAVVIDAHVKGVASACDNPKVDAQCEALMRAIDLMTTDVLEPEAANEVAAV